MDKVRIAEWLLARQATNNAPKKLLATFWSKHLAKTKELCRGDC